MHSKRDDVRIWITIFSVLDFLNLVNLVPSTMFLYAILILIKFHFRILCGLYIFCRGLFLRCLFKLDGIEYIDLHCVAVDAILLLVSCERSIAETPMIGRFSLLSQLLNWFFRVIVIGEITRNHTRFTSSDLFVGSADVPIRNRVLRQMNHLN